MHPCLEKLKKKIPANLYLMGDGWLLPDGTLLRNYDGKRSVTHADIGEIAKKLCKLGGSEETQYPGYYELEHLGATPLRIGGFGKSCTVFYETGAGSTPTPQQYRFIDNILDETGCRNLTWAIFNRKGRECARQNYSEGEHRLWKVDLKRAFDRCHVEDT